MEKAALVLTWIAPRAPSDTPSNEKAGGALVLTERSKTTGRNVGLWKMPTLAASWHVICGVACVTEASGSSAAFHAFRWELSAATESTLNAVVSDPAEVPKVLSQWKRLARALVVAGQMFQRGGGVQPAARPSFKCFFFLAVATSIPPRMFDVGRRQIAARRLRVVFSPPDQNQAVSK